MERLYDLADTTAVPESCRDNVELESINLLSEYTELEMEQLPYPVLIIDGLTSEEEFLHFRDRPYEEDVAVPLYCFIEGEISRVGMLDFTMDSLLAIRTIGDYKLVLMKNRETEVEVQLDDPVFLSKFIKLC